MQEIPAILKVRRNENEVSPKAIGVEIRKEVKRKICALLIPKEQKHIYTHVGDNDICGQEFYTTNTIFNTR